MQDESLLRWGVLAAALVGGIVLIAAAFASADDLSGRTWVAEELTIDGTTTEPLPGTVLSALFDNSSVSGIAGCNSYFAGFGTDGSEIRIGLTGSTKMLCAEPPGIMRQEAEYLRLLNLADEFELDRESLTLLADGEAIIVFAEADVAEG